MKEKLWHIGNATTLSLIVAFITLKLVPEIPYLKEFVDPVLDWDFTDHFYDDFEEQSVGVDSSFVLVNIGDLDREGIAKLINRVNKESPLAVGLSMYFTARKDSAKDLKLKQALDSTKNLVMVFGNSIQTEPFFLSNATKAYVDLEDDNLGIGRSLKPTVQINGEEYWHFAIEMASFLDHTAKDIISKRQKDLEYIKFFGKQFNFTLLDSKEEDYSLVKDKVVMFGVLGYPKMHDYQFEDNHLTPLNIEYYGNLIPDMYGVVIHANSVKMILEKNFINYNRHFDVYGSLILCFLIMLGYYYLHNYTRHFLLLARISSLGLIVGSIAVTLWIFSSFSFKFDISGVVLFLLVGSDMYEFYFRYYQQALEKAPSQKIRLLQNVFMMMAATLLISVLFKSSLLIQIVSIFLIVYYIAIRVGLVLTERQTGDKNSMGKHRDTK